MSFHFILPFEDNFSRGVVGGEGVQVSVADVLVHDDPDRGGIPFSQGKILMPNYGEYRHISAEKYYLFENILRLKFILFNFSP